MRCFAARSHKTISTTSPCFYREPHRSSNESRPVCSVFHRCLFPDVGIATLELLERVGCEVDYPLDQTCCGQPMGNSGCEKDAAATENLFVRNFAGYDYIVAPSGVRSRIERCPM